MKNDIFYSIPANVAETNNERGYFARFWEIKRDLGVDSTYKQAYEKLEEERMFYGYAQNFTYGTFRVKLSQNRHSTMENGLKFV